MEDIPRIIDAANANRVVPIHGEHPELFTQWHDNVLADIEIGNPLALG
jgi:hypothetical protein